MATNVWARMESNLELESSLYDFWNIESISVISRLEDNSRFIFNGLNMWATKTHFYTLVPRLPFLPLWPSFHFLSLLSLNNILSSFSKLFLLFLDTPSLRAPHHKQTIQQHQRHHHMPSRWTHEPRTKEETPYTHLFLPAPSPFIEFLRLVLSFFDEGKPRNLSKTCRSCLGVCLGVVLRSFGKIWTYETHGQSLPSFPAMTATLQPFFGQP